MKAIIVLQEDQTKWLRSYFPSAHPAMILICNKTLLEYILDFIILSKCSHIIICMEATGSDINAYFENGARWGVHISYCRNQPDEIIDGIIKKNMGNLPWKISPSSSWTASFSFIMISPISTSNMSILRMRDSWSAVFPAIS